MKRSVRFVSATAVFTGVVVFGGGELFAQTTPAPQPTNCTRACWNGTSNNLPSTTGLNRAVIHHTVRVYGNVSLNHSKGVVRDIQAYNKSLGWLDIAYHFLTDALGNVFQGLRGRWSQALTIAAPTMEQTPAAMATRCSETTTITLSRAPAEVRCGR